MKAEDYLGKLMFLTIGINISHKNMFFLLMFLVILPVIFKIITSGR